MNWEEWDKAYPVIVLETIPPNIDLAKCESFNSRIDAESNRDWMEQFHEQAFRVFKYGNTFYVVESYHFD